MGRIVAIVVLAVVGMGIVGCGSQEKSKVFYIQNAQTSSIQGTWHDDASIACKD